MRRSARRTWIVAGFLSAVLLAPAWALNLADITNQEASGGIKGALNSGISSAVGKLGVPGGFLNNPKVKIPLPPALEEVASGMRLLGQGKQADELVAKMNAAAEQAVPMAKPLLVSAVKSMTLSDAKQILTGGEDSITQFFRAKTSVPLAAKFLPIVKQTTDHVGLAHQYDQFAGEAAKLDLLKGHAVTIEQYVTEKALDGLYLMIGEEERAIRQNPAAAGSALVQKVFGALR